MAGIQTNLLQIGGIPTTTEVQRVSRRLTRRSYIRLNTVKD
jgi:hypothetical protein